MAFVGWIEPLGAATNGVEALQYRARKGEAQAQFDIALRCARGQGVAQDFTEAAKWYRKLAKRGYPTAQFNLAVLYERGAGVPQDFEEAVKWYRKAAQQGYVSGEYLLGWHYAYGRGLHPDFLQAAKWLRTAADQNDALAEYEYARLLETGCGVEENHQQAVKWYRKAADQGELRAQCALGVLLGNGDQVLKDSEEARKWFGKAAGRGYALAQFNLGLVYYYGNGVRTDHREAAKWFQKAAEQGDKKADWYLARIGPDGNSPPGDPPRASEPDFANVTTCDGMIENKMTVEGVEPDGIIIGHAPQGGEMGVRKPDVENLPESRQPRFNYQPRRAADFSDGQARLRGEPSAPILRQDGPRRGHAKLGTGFFVTEDGYMVTCAHVVRGATAFQIKTSDGFMPVRLVAKDDTIDIALLKATGTFWALPVAAEPGVKLGDSVFTIGFPNTDLQGFEPKFTKGEISSLAGFQDNPRRFQISVPTQPGNSGGALVDERGNVVGVVAAILNDLMALKKTGVVPQNVNYAVKGGLVYNFLDNVPELSGELRPLHTEKDQEAANLAAERASVLIRAE